MWAVVASLENEISFTWPLLSRVRRMLARGTRKLSQNHKRTNFLCRVRDGFVTSRGSMISPGVYKLLMFYTTEQKCHECTETIPQ